MVHEPRHRQRINNFVKPDRRNLDSHDVAIEMDYHDPRPRIHRWISWTNAIFVVLHSVVVFAVLFSPLLASQAAPVILTNGLLALHGLLAGILAMHQISINLSFDTTNYYIPDILLVAPSNLIVVVNIVCLVFNVLHVVSLVSVSMGNCATGIEAATCSASRNAAIVAAVLSALASAVNVGGTIAYARVCCANEQHLPGITHMLSKIPSTSPESLKENRNPQNNTPTPTTVNAAVSTTSTTHSNLRNHIFRIGGNRNSHPTLTKR